MDRCDCGSGVATVTEGPAGLPVFDVRNVLSHAAGTAVQVGRTDQLTIYGTAPEPYGDATPPGVPLSQCSPYDLEVHATIDAAEPGRSDVSLPTYVEREHDARLRAAVGEAVAGRNVILVLVGGSSTGKTRACWEAVRPRATNEPGRLPPDWRLWHPINPGRPEAVLSELRWIAPRTVLWLNETHHYLLTPGSAIGEQVAAGLRDLLRNPNRGPVLVLGTLWQEYWNILLRAPAGGAEDPHAQARDLLTGASVAVPDTFASGDLKAATGTGDQRLADAIRHARDGQITQYLAGAPALLERYRHAPPATRALITAAIDARRLGHGLFLSPDLLAAAASGYLTDTQWSHLPEDWLPTALRDACALCQGGTSPLIRIRPRPGQTLPADVNLRLEDYLEQTGSRTRATIPPPPVLWHALLTHAPREDCSALGAAAEQRGLYHLAFQFYTRAATNEATDRSGRLLERCGRIDEALRHYQHATASGDPIAARQVGLALARAGQTDQALTWYRRAGEAGDAVAQRLIAEHLITAGQIMDATTWLQTCVEAGNRSANDMLEHLRNATSRRKTDAGNAKEKPGWFTFEQPSTREAGDRLLTTAEELAESGDIDQAIAVYQQMTLQGSISWVLRSGETASVERSRMWYVNRSGRSKAIERAAQLFRETSRLDEGLHWLRTLADTGDEDAIDNYASLLEYAGRISEAIIWYQRTAETMVAARSVIATGWARARHRDDVPSAMGNAVRLLSTTDRTDEALEWLRRLANDGDGAARRSYADLLGDAGRVDEAIVVYQRAAEAGDREALRNAMNLAVQTDQREMVGRWIQSRIDTGDTVLRKAFADVLAGSGRADKAIILLKPLARCGDAEAAKRLSSLLVEAGRLDDAISWLTGHPEHDANDTLREVAESLERNGRIDDAIRVYRQIAETGQTHALIRAVRLAEQRGQAPRMITWLQTRIDAGDSTALRLVAELCEGSGRIDEAIDWYRMVAEAGSASGLERAVRLLETSGRPDEARRLQQFGLAPGGSTSDEWSAP